MTTYPAIEANVQRLIALLPTAVSLDSAEAQLLLNSPVLKAMTCDTGVAAHLIQADAAQARQQAVQAVVSLLGHHRWLAASRDSRVLLQEAATRWSSARSVADQALAEMGAMAARAERPWSGRSEQGQRSWTVAQRDAQAELAAATGKLSQGCTNAGTLIDAVMTRAALIVLQGLVTAQPRVTRAPRLSTSLFGLNGRVKSFAEVTSKVAAQYQELRVGSDWRAISRQIADLYDGETKRLTRTFTGPQAV